MAIKIYDKKEKTQLSKNFKSNEFNCQGKDCCTKTQIDDKLVEHLQNIREHFDSPVTISSGYRCSKHNKKVGGSSGSYHTKGMAVDIMVKGVKPAEVAKYAESIGILGIGLYETYKDGYFVHIDTREKKSFWYGQKQEYRSTFGGVNAVKRWQLAAVADGFKFSEYGIDGVWGSECEKVASEAVCSCCFFPWKNKNLTKIIQEAVGVTVDGKFGNGTKKAVIEYQKKNGLFADGKVGLNTWKMILGV
jgi:hypothetical protein